MQKRVKTYGKHSSRIITLTDDKQPTIPQKTVTSVTQPTVNNHVSSSESSDDQPNYSAPSNRSKSIVNTKGKMDNSKRSSARRSQLHDERTQAQTLSLQELRKQAKAVEFPHQSKTETSHNSIPRRPIADKARTQTTSVATTIHVSNPRETEKGKKKDVEHFGSIYVIDSSDSEEAPLPKAKPKAGAPRKYIVSESSETSSFESTSEGEEPTASSSDDNSPSPTARHAVKESNSSSSRPYSGSRGQTNNSGTKNNVPKPVPRSHALKLAPPKKMDDTIELSSESEDNRVFDTRLPTKSYANTPQVKASHLRQARIRKGTPFRHIPRISLASTLTLSPISPLNLVSSKSLASKGVSLRDPIPEPPSPTSLPPSSPLTWEESLTPEAVRIHDIESDDEGQVSSAAIQKLLKFGGQPMPIDFLEFLEIFKTRDIEALSSMVNRDKARTVQRASLKYRKIGDASYSEVFSIGDLVLKVVPLAVEIETDSEDDSEDGDIEIPFKSSPESVLKEVMITKVTGDTVDGFIKLLKTYIVKGKYPRSLIKEWDDFKRNNGSDGIRPSSFTEHQLYAIVVLPNGGIDLESYSFGKATSSGGATKGGSPWRDAAEVFWQVTKALAKAEELLKFEHRDLHWGQIVIQKSKPTKVEEFSITSTIIDLGLSRVQTVNGVQFSAFEDDVFTGRGILPGPDDGTEHDEGIEPDYQFDIYRLMRHCNGDEWTAYRPLTNVMWLHYLSTKLLRHKSLRKPTSKQTAIQEKKGGTANISTGAPHLESEWHAYQQLVAVERCLGSRLEPIVDEMVQKYGKGKQAFKAKKQGRPPKATVDHSSKSTTMTIESAADVAVLWFATAW